MIAGWMGGSRRKQLLHFSSLIWRIKNESGKVEDFFLLA
jgi:hypothetical protein